MNKLKRKLREKKIARLRRSGRLENYITNKLLNKTSFYRPKMPPERVLGESSIMPYSITYIGIIVALVSYLAKVLELDLLPGDIETTVYTLTAIIGALVGLFGRWRKGDINVLGVRKPKKVVNTNQ